MTSAGTTGKKADLFTLFVEIHRAIFKRKIAVDPEQISKALKDFYAAVDGVIDPNNNATTHGLYYKASLQATNDRGSRVRRGEIIQSEIDKQYTPQLRVEQATFGMHVDTN